jgi:hypothetical protein
MVTGSLIESGCVHVGWGLFAVVAGVGSNTAVLGGVAIFSGCVCACVRACVCVCVCVCVCMIAAFDGSI